MLGRFAEEVRAQLRLSRERNASFHIKHEKSVSLFNTPISCPASALNSALLNASLAVDVGIRVQADVETGFNLSGFFPLIITNFMLYAGAPC